MEPSWQDAAKVQELSQACAEGSTQDARQVGDNAATSQPASPAKVPIPTLVAGAGAGATEVPQQQPLDQRQPSRRQSTRVKFIKCLQCAGWEVTAAPPNASAVDLCTCHKQPVEEKSEAASAAAREGKSKSKSKPSRSRNRSRSRARAGSKRRSASVMQPVDENTHFQPSGSACSSPCQTPKQTFY